MLARFPEFRPISLVDRPAVQDWFWKYQPETSELTFTNLFIWRAHYRVMLSVYNDWLLIVFSRTINGAVGLPPVGPSPREAVTHTFLDWLKDMGQGESRLERCDARLVSELAGAGDLTIEPVRDDFDYVYRTEDLVGLAGRRYHAKRNFINTFRSNNHFTYEDLTQDNAAACQKMVEMWCQQRRCEEDLGLSDENIAVNEALENFANLKLKGGLIRIDGRVEAFAIGELLNNSTGVVHIEKANPEIRGLYAVINQQFAAHAFEQVPFVNREQDLGDLSLRQAKESYQPDHMAEKYRIRLKSA